MSVKTPRILAPVISLTCSHKLVPSLCDQILPQTLHHVDTFRSFCQLPFGRCQDAFETYDHQITDDKGPDVVRPTAHEFLFKLDDRVADGRFHGSCLARKDYRSGAGDEQAET